MTAKERIHFHSIDALRFFAFLKVYLLHLPEDGDFPIFEFLKRGGGTGVIFFFTLSGFLISYILIKEKQELQQIRIKRFFLRRVLRIWPLYFLMLFIAFGLPSDFLGKIGFHMVGGGYDPDWYWSATFLENYKMILMDNVPRTTPLPVMWSLCIEEHFYIVWCLLVAFCPLKRLPWVFIGGFILANVARLSEPFIIPNQNVNSNDLITNLDFFAIGGLLAYFAAEHYNRLHQFVTKMSVRMRQGILWGVLLVVVFQMQIFSLFDWMKHIHISALAILFGLAILVLIPQDSPVRIKSRVLNYLGQISYGLYLFHIMFIHAALQYCLNHKILLDTGLKVSLFIAFTKMDSIISSASLSSG